MLSAFIDFIQSSAARAWNRAFAPIAAKETTMATAPTSTTAAALAAAAKPAVTSIVTSLLLDAEKGIDGVWSAISTDIEGDVATLEAKLPAWAKPGLAVLEATAKQGASTVLGMTASGLTGAEPALAVGLEALLDTAWDTATGGQGVALNGFINAGGSGFVALVSAAASAWLLKKQASLA